MSERNLWLVGWIGTIAEIVLILLIIDHAGPWSLVWSVPLILLGEFGCFAERDLHHQRTQGGE